MSCTYPTIGDPWPLSAALSQLAQRLDDTGRTHWTTAELTRYLTEALRTLSAFTQRYRGRTSFSTTANQPFYDLPTVATPLRDYTVTLGDLVRDVEYALMEPATGLTWTGTEQFTAALVQDALNQRYQQFRRETGAVQTRTVTTGVTPDATGRITLDPAIDTLRRVAWKLASGRVVPLTREDEWAMTHYARTWPQTPTPPGETWPTGYSVGVTPPLTVQLAPAPPSAGTLDVVAVSVGATLVVDGDLVEVPADWAWVIKWGALADLLSRDGVAFDPTRAAYCEQRYQQGISLATAASVVLNGSINGNLIILRSLAETDRYRRNWQTTSGIPTTVFTAGQSLVGLVVPPNGAYTVALDLVQNVPLPVDEADCLAVDEPLRDPFLDYAQHLAVFKEGAGQNQQSQALYDRFQRACGITTLLESASVPARGPLLQQTVQDTRVEDRLAPAEPTLP